MAGYMEEIDVKNVLEKLKSNTTLDPTTGCINWNKCTDQGGYGCVWIVKLGMRRAHRLSWICHNGKIPKGFSICHKCDNPSCCNIDHLFVGNHIDNMRDMILKGRKVLTFGEKQHLNKLKEYQVIEIREFYKNTHISYGKMSKKYGVSDDTIRLIVLGRIWKHLL